MHQSIETTAPEPWDMFRQNTDPQSTDPLLTPLVTPYEINGKMKIKKAQNYILFWEFANSPFSNELFMHQSIETTAPEPWDIAGNLTFTGFD